MTRPISGNSEYALKYSTGASPAGFRLALSLRPQQELFTNRTRMLLSLSAQMLRVPLKKLVDAFNSFDAEDHSLESRALLVTVALAKNMPVRKLAEEFAGLGRVPHMIGDEDIDPLYKAIAIAVAKFRGVSQEEAISLYPRYETPFYNTHIIVLAQALTGREIKDLIGNDDPAALSLPPEMQRLLEEDHSYYGMIDRYIIEMTLLRIAMHLSGKNYSQISKELLSFEKQLGDCSLSAAHFLVLGFNVIKNFDLAKALRDYRKLKFSPQD